MMKINKGRYLSWIKNSGRIASVAARVLLALLIICVVYSGFAQKKIADNVVRLHIIANSDSVQDQTLKLKVRDAVLKHMQDKYPNGSTKAEAARYLKDSLPEIKLIAKGVLSTNGCDEPVEARYGVYPFPTKVYENISLPAGMYEAVRIELGEAQGQNWWCVMFPPLCIADSNAIKMSDLSEEQLKTSLGASSFSLVTDVSDDENIPVKVKFRIVELVQNSRLKLAELISSLF